MVRKRESVLLLDDLPQSEHRKGDVVQVAPGFYRNFLLPKNLARKVSPHVLRLRKKLQEERAKKAVADRNQAMKVAAELRDVIIETTEKIDDTGHLYGSVKDKDIKAMLKAKGYVVRKVLLKKPFKKLGEFPIDLLLDEGVEATCSLKILGDREIETPEPTEEPAPDEGDKVDDVVDVKEESSQ